ncbi:rhodanese-like domain-containing protein [Neobacillus notoginsengisoli]|uniref:Rhodanese-like domain-containing protein n=1 Tax=Neobacillus notoginsengisoli TaxID=1578198 RepID=A0A417YUK9_9BACI|nr:rhodanese-like domain-containing protein [Neobacillus notoginsengisoli]RHW40805.1 rhodanese-like domain-containing protein [Neobacillus notoginsengisoli]
MEEIKSINTEELKKKLDNGDKLELIDVREDEEVAYGMIPGAKHMKMSDIPNRLNELDKGKEYIFICRSGGRSFNVCHYLQQQGYKVTNMEGGMLEWGGDVEVNL